MGLRFDLSALSYIAIIPFLLNLFAAFFLRTQFRWWQIQRFNYYYFLVGLFLLAVLLGCDTGYYSYFQDHFNVLIFGLINDDTTAVLKSFWKNYPVVFLLVGYSGLGFLLNRLLRHLFLCPFIPATKSRPTWQIGLLFTVPILILFFSARGSFGLFPLSVQDTVVSSRSFLNHLAYNGFHAFIRAIKLKRQENSQWNSNLVFYGYQNPKDAFADYFDVKPNKVPEDPLQLLHHQTAANPWAAKVKPHVLVLVMESFGSAYLKYDSPNFQIMGELKKHFAEDFSTLLFLPSHNSTIGSLSSLMISAPQRPNSGFLTESLLLQVPFRTSGARIFKSAGYHTRFIYGGNPGWRDIHKFAKFQGYDSIEGDVDIDKELGGLKEKHDWGIYDEDVFKYLEKTLLAATSPEMILTMTTTNHPPYMIPSTYNLGPLHVPAELDSRLLADRDLVKSRFQAYQYSNQKLGEFLTRLKQSPLKDRLIVAVTGDHSFWMVNFSDQEHLQKWGVPFYLYVPPGIKPKAFPRNIFGSHFDIFPTLYPLALDRIEYDALGQNLLSPETTINSQSYFSSSLALNSEGGILAQKGPDQFAAFRWAAPESKSGNPYARLESGEPTPSLRLLAKKYKALMSVTDYYFMRESQKPRQEKKSP